MRQLIVLVCASMVIAAMVTSAQKAPVEEPPFAFNDGLFNKRVAAAAVEAGTADFQTREKTILIRQPLIEVVQNPELGTRTQRTVLGYVDSEFEPSLRSDGSAGHLLTMVSYLFVILDFEGVASSTALLVRYEKRIGAEGWVKVAAPVETTCFHKWMPDRWVNQLYQATAFLHDYPTQQIVPFQPAADHTALAVLYMVASVATAGVSSTVTNNVFAKPNTLDFWTGLAAQQGLSAAFDWLKNRLDQQELLLGRGHFIENATAIKHAHRHITAGKSTWLNDHSPQGCPAPSAPRGIRIVP